jgi:hypothetical protein
MMFMHYPNREHKKQLLTKQSSLPFQRQRSKKFSVCQICEQSQMKEKVSLNCGLFGTSAFFLPLVAQRAS